MCVLKIIATITSNGWNCSKTVMKCAGDGILNRAPETQNIQKTAVLFLVFLPDHRMYEI